MDGWIVYRIEFVIINRFCNALKVYFPGMLTFGVDGIWEREARLAILHRAANLVRSTALLWGYGMLGWKMTDRERWRGWLYGRF